MLAEAAPVHTGTVREWEAGRQVRRVEAVATSPASCTSPRPICCGRSRAPRRRCGSFVAAGRSQQQVADAAGLLRNTYSAVERGETATLSFGDTTALADALGVTADQVHAAHTASRAGRREQHR